MLKKDSKRYCFSQKADYDKKISDIEKKYFTTSYQNKFANEMLDAKIRNKELVDKSDIYKFIINSDLDKKIETLATKAELKAQQNKIVKLQTYDSNLFIGQSYFFSDGLQNLLIFLKFL